MKHGIEISCNLGCFIPRKLNWLNNFWLKLIATESGKTTAYGINLIQPRGELFVEPGVDVYEGMVIGENARDGDLDVNPCKGKALTNMFKRFEFNIKCVKVDNIEDLKNYA